MAKTQGEGGGKTRKPVVPVDPRQAAYRKTEMARKSATTKGLASPKPPLPGRRALPTTAKTPAPTPRQIARHQPAAQRDTFKPGVKLSPGQVQDRRGQYKGPPITGGWARIQPPVTQSPPPRQAPEPTMNNSPTRRRQPYGPSKRREE